MDINWVEVKGVAVDRVVWRVRVAVLCDPPGTEITI